MDRGKPNTMPTLDDIDLLPFFSLQEAWLEGTKSLLKNNQLPLSGNVDQWIRTWGEAVSQIGFFNVNVAGSGNPRLEKTISSEYSYGRQLGRVLDVLAPLVAANEGALRKEAGDKAVEDFQDMVRDIRQLKSRSVTDIVDEVKQWQTSSTFQEDLATLLLQLAALSTAVK
jgi:hypothetical protein